jgi:hypothetical protein
LDVASQISLSLLLIGVKDDVTSVNGTSISGAAAVSIRDAIELRDDVIRWQALIAARHVEANCSATNLTFYCLCAFRLSIDDSELWNLYF